MATGGIANGTFVEAFTSQLKAYWYRSTVPSPLSIHRTLPNRLHLLPLQYCAIPVECRYDIAALLSLSCHLQALSPTPD